MTNNNFSGYKQLANKIRAQTLTMIHRARSSHIGSSFSMADLLAVLYSGVLRIDPSYLNDPDRDRFLLSKGHACAGVYAVLAEKGFFPCEWLLSFYQDGSNLPGHVTRGIPGIEASTGSLGHGLPIACGMALAGKTDNRSYRVFAVLSDGECDEGSTWEAVLFAPHHRLDNLIAIVDYNKIQSFGNVKEVLNLDPLAQKWHDFGWACKEIDGHDYKQIEEALTSVPFEKGKPSCIIAHTVKGKGVSFMEDSLLWHYKSPNDEEFRKAMIELEAKP